MAENFNCTFLVYSRFVLAFFLRPCLFTIYLRSSVLGASSKFEMHKAEWQKSRAEQSIKEESVERGGNKLKIETQTQ